MITKMRKNTLTVSFENNCAKRLFIHILQCSYPKWILEDINRMVFQNIKTHKAQDWEGWLDRMQPREMTRAAEA